MGIVFRNLEQNRSFDRMNQSDDSYFHIIWEYSESVKY